MTSLIAQSGRFVIGSDVISVAMSVAVLFAVDVECCMLFFYACICFLRESELYQTRRSLCLLRWHLKGGHG